MSVAFDELCDSLGAHRPETLSDEQLASTISVLQQFEAERSSERHQLFAELDLLSAELGSSIPRRFSQHRWSARQRQLSRSAALSLSCGRLSRWLRNADLFARVCSIVQRVAVLSLHTSPLTQPGSGDSGGMNVYVRELVSALAQAGVDCTTYTRASRPDQPEVVQIEPGHRVVHIQAGPFDLRKEDLPSVLPEFGDAVIDHLKNGPGVDVMHANYWLSGLVGHRIKHELGIPLMSTFHTLAGSRPRAATTNQLVESWQRPTSLAAQMRFA